MLAASVWADPFLLTRLIRGMTWVKGYGFSPYVISTHTPHTRHDDSREEHRQKTDISTHTPHTRHDLSCSPLVPLR